MGVLLAFDLALALVVTVVSARYLWAQTTSPPLVQSSTPEGALYQAAGRSVFRIEAGLAHGSGFLIDPDGLIATNDHVVGRAREVTVYIDAQTRVGATVVARDQDADLALLRVVPSVLAGRSPLPLASPQTVLSPGQRVVALGYPLTQPLTVSAGMIANVRSGAILTDATVNPGNSGGPILTLDGIVVAITTFHEVGGSTVGPGLGGAVLVDRLQELRRNAGPTVGGRPDDRRLPVFPTATYPVSILKSLADTLDPLLFASLGTVKSGPFEIMMSTPLSRMLSAVSLGQAVSKDRRKRERRAGVPKDERYGDLGEIRDWAAYVGDETAPVVAVKVTPLFGETGGSAFRRGLLIAIVGVGGQATARFQGDVRNVTLRRNGVVVEPLRGGHAPVSIAFENSLLEFNDVADFGYYLYPPETFRPDGPQKPPEIVLEIEDLKNAGESRREKLRPEAVARLWNDFDGYFSKRQPGTPFPRYRMVKSCSAQSGASAMGGASAVGGGEANQVCTYLVAPPGTMP